MRTAFEDIYKNKTWNDEYCTQSGSGASIECSGDYVEWLKGFIRQQGIKSILDLGCGDFNLMKHLDFAGLNYLGVDIVDFVIEENQNKHGSDDIKFVNDNIIGFNPEKKFDLAIVKDVLQHLPNDKIITFFKKLNCAKRVLVVNDIGKKNNDILSGKYRGVNPRKQPFNIDCKKVFEFNACGFLKYVYQYDVKNI